MSELRRPNKNLSWVYAPVRVDIDKGETKRHILTGRYQSVLYCFLDTFSASTTNGKEREYWGNGKTSRHVQCPWIPTEEAFGRTPVLERI